MTSGNQEQAKLRALGGQPPRLPLRIAARVAWTSIKVRFSRSLVTVSSVILAVAFLLVVVSEHLINRAVHQRLSWSIQPAEDLALIQDTLANPRKPAVLCRMLSDPRQRASLPGWCTSLAVVLPDCPPQAAAQTVDLITWFASLKATDRFQLIGTQDMVLWILALRDGPPMENLRQLAQGFRGVRLPCEANGRLIDLQSLGKAMACVEASVKTLQQAERVRIERVQQGGGSALVLQKLGETQAPLGQLDAELSPMGLPVGQILPGLDQQRFDRLRAQLAKERLRTAAGQALDEYNRTAQRENPGKVRPLRLRHLVDRDLPEQDRNVADEVVRKALGPAGLVQVRDDLDLRKTNDQLQKVFLSLGYDPTATGERAFWLVILSLLVCVVGIVNSLTMAVTERFIEIATMKCLGATDGFIIRTFLLESGSIGLCGGVIGAAVGLPIALAQGWFRFGTGLIPALPVQILAGSAMLAVVCGLILAVVGALLPAYKAACMHPIEAMRLEA